MCYHGPAFLKNKISTVHCFLYISIAWVYQLTSPILKVYWVSYQLPKVIPPSTCLQLCNYNPGSHLRFRASIQATRIVGTWRDPAAYLPITYEHRKMFYAFSPFTTILLDIPDTLKYSSSLQWPVTSYVRRNSLHCFSNSLFALLCIYCTVGRYSVGTTSTKQKEDAYISGIGPIGNPAKCLTLGSST